MLRLFENAQELEQKSFSFPVASDPADWKKLETAVFDPEFLKEYKNINGAKFSWNSQKDSSIYGSCRFLKAKDIIAQQKAVLVFNDTSTDDWQNDFYPIDFFTDEACAGVFAGKQASNCMYLYLMDDEYPLNLNVTVQAYFDLMIAAFAFEYWQLALKAISTKKSNPSSERFQFQMPILFHGFSFNDFVEKYQLLKI
ncbi:MAG: hypothetical protein GXC73_19770 [Chitinophagaceae bacterium]|nr:hypothetical protein [Chitinophagaceae bacterium]